MVVGVGGRLDSAPADLAEALEQVADRHGPRTADRLRRFAAETEGTLAWTRSADGRLWLGRVEGPWHFDASPEAADLDLQHVRSCRWLDDPVPPVDVPDAVLAAFARGGRNLQRIRQQGVGRRSLALHEARSRT
jgi:hypothetical protein